MPAPKPGPLLLPPLLEAIDAWRAEPSPEREDAFGSALRGVAERLDLGVGRLRVTAPPLPDLDLDLGAHAAGPEIALRTPGDGQPIGSVQISGEIAQAHALAHGIELGLIAARGRARADRSDAQLRALDQAVRGISGVLDLDRVLQVIVDRVRELVDAQYAALGIVDADGQIERFITSGITAEERKRIGALPRGRGLLGLIIRENRTYRIPDIAVHAERYGFPPEHPEMHSFLGMPIITEGAAVGRLYLTNKLGAVEFSPDDQRLVEMFALHAGIAIENARLHDQVRRLAVVDERDRISRDLHDSVIQAIYAQTLALDDVPELVTDDPDEARRRVDEAIDALHAVIRDIRNFIFGLRPVLLETGSLSEGIEHLATELRRNGGVDVEVAMNTPAVEDLPIEMVAELLSITREGLSNIARHASATRALISLTDSGSGELRLELSDDGRGFHADDDVARGHHGLANMRARTEGLSGTFELSSGDGAGTRIIITLPPRLTTAKGDDE